jgi:hypothetical protein
MVMTTTANLIRLETNLKENVKGEYEFRNAKCGANIIIKGMADYSAKSYLEKNNLHYFTFPPNFRKPIKQ